MLSPLWRCVFSTFEPKSSDVFLVLLSWRIFNATIVQTFYVPDEYWQSLEVAHHMAFGSGHLTWEWDYEIRSISYPLIFAAFYKVLSCLGLDNGWIVAYGPMYIQAVFAAITDFTSYSISRKLHSEVAAKLNLVITVSSFYLFYSSTRTLSNCMEAMLICMAVNFMIDLTQHRAQKSLVGFMAACVSIFFLRPSSAMPLLPIIGRLLYIISRQRDSFGILLRLFAYGLGFLIFNIAIDSFYYGHFTVTPWNFFKANLMGDIASYYGVHTFHWYVTQGLPVVIGFSLPFLPHFLFTGHLMESKCENRMLASSILFTILILSILPHKEFRFLHGIVPICSVGCALSISKLARIHQKKLILYLEFSIISSILIGVYLSMIDQRAPMAVVDHLRNHVKQNDSIHFWTECHSTPYYSHLHTGFPIRMEIFDCTYIKHGSDHQSQGFLRSPEQAIHSLYITQQRTFPDWIVVFRSHASLLKQILVENRYDEVFSCHQRWIVDPVNSVMVIYQRRS
eukprot:TRINITY_DN5687_c0_g2_i2.p1 TRINITY_DN5687_c0_g2~~TRINITY_DN5687_c0_g2_i2.p1  ORF type:complete len:509 (-),score=52.26 TRINITY_DN5687_c0_g2_i2:138-1664(-)